MKNARKLASLLLALVMVLSLATTAFAADGDVDNGKITINDAIAGQTYTIYQILDLESYNKESGAYSYKATSAWKSFVEGNNVKDVYLATDAQGYVTWVEGADVTKFALLAKAHADTLTTNEGTVTAETATVTFENLDLGYYLVDTTLGTICSLDTTNNEVVMEEKNEAPTVTKEVQEDSNNTWGETNDADINQVVNFKATITVQAGAENYVLHDTMSAGLTYTGVTSVKIGETAVDASNYTVTSTGLTDGCTFEVAFKDEYIATLTAGTQIVVEYSAKLNENAVVGLDGNTNKVKLEYGDDADPSYTPEDTTTTYTWDAKVIKYTMNGEGEAKLAGATFKLTTDEAGNSALKFHNLGENKYEHCADAACTKDHVTEITTDATGTFNIEGLDAGTYYLHETAAPAGYNKLAGPVTVTITGATKGENGALTYSTVETKVENKAGSELPSTGGMGTTIFYTIGGLMMLAAVVLLATKKRMGAAE